MSFSSIHLYFDDLEVGQEWVSGGRTVLEADIVNFAGFSGDFNPIHIDHEFAKGTPFRRAIAHLRVKSWDFRLPVFAGDTIRAKCRVVEKTLRGRGKRGEVVWYRSVLNQ